MPSTRSTPSTPSTRSTPSMFQLRGNQLSGPIPTNLFKSLIYLEVVDISENDLSGPLPYLGESLRELDVHSNQVGERVSG